VRTDDPADDFRYIMVETNVLTRLVGLLQDKDSDVRQSAIEAITALAKFGKLIYHFVLCEG
jgi:hypothetical protein